MADLSLDLNKASLTFGDLVLVNGDLVINTGVDAIRQNIIQRLRTYLGEWFLDNRVGVPFYQQILVKNPNKGVIDGIFQNTILGTAGMQSLNKYSSSINTVTRQFFVEFTGTTTQGQVDYSGLI